MRYRIEPPGWRIAGGSEFLPAGTIVDTADPNCPAKELTPPINARALDQAAWQALLEAYGSEHKHLLGGGWQ